MRSVWRALRGLDDVEIAVYACIAAVCIVVGPIYLAWRLIAAERYAFASTVGLVWMGCVGLVIRDMRQGRCSWITTAICALWLTGTVLVGLAMT